MVLPTLGRAAACLAAAVLCSSGGAAQTFDRTGRYELVPDEVDERRRHRGPPGLLGRRRVLGAEGDDRPPAVRLLVAQRVQRIRLHRA